MSFQSSNHAYRKEPGRAVNLSLLSQSQQPARGGIQPRRDRKDPAGAHASSRILTLLTSLGSVLILCIQGYFVILEGLSFHLPPHPPPPSVSLGLVQLLVGADRLQVTCAAGVRGQSLSPRRSPPSPQSQSPPPHAPPRPGAISPTMGQAKPGTKATAARRGSGGRQPPAPAASSFIDALVLYVHL